MTDDLISRSALRVEMEAYVLPILANNLMGATDAYYRTLHLLDEAPAVDAVEVVRCKDCKHCSQNTPDGLHWCEENEIGALMDDDFCSYGERRADDA